MMQIKRTHYQYLLVVGSLLFSCLISSCKKHPVISRNNLSHTKRASIQAQSQHTDIPLPLGCTLIKKQNNLTSTFLHYTSPLTQARTTTFYINEMERSGWEIINLSPDKNESMLVCSKPSKTCVVSLRKSSIRLFIRHTNV